MKIITISREFGSGGRELGKRLADVLGYAYYDREIEDGIAKRMNMDVNYVAHAMEGGAVGNIPLHFGRTFTGAYALRQQMDILAEKHKLLTEIVSASHCIIVGRAADVILADHRPFKMFVYADMAHKIKRCQAYAEVGENLSPAQMEKAIKKIDAGRAQYHRMFAGEEWGDKNQYHLCVNTTGVTIKSIVPIVAQYAECWFAQTGTE